MKIVYAIGNYSYPSFQLSELLKYLNSQHEVLIAGYPTSTADVKNVHWNLDAIHLRHRYPETRKEIPHGDQKQLKELLGVTYLIGINVEIVKIIISEVLEFDPDLIISDDEKLFAFIANALNIKLWYCSALNLYSSVVDVDLVTFQKYCYGFNNFLDHFSYLPTADKYLISHPFSDLDQKIKMDPKWNWIKPYNIKINSKEEKNDIKGIGIISDLQRSKDVEILLNSLDVKIPIYNNLNTIESQKNFKNSEWVMISGETDLLTQAMFNGKSICISPTISNPETLINTILVNKYNIGDDLEQVEFLGQVGADLIKQSFDNRNVKYKIIDKSKYLHEVISEYEQK